MHAMTTVSRTGAGLAAALAAALILSLAAPAGAQDRRTKTPPALESYAVKSLAARSIGPAVMGGRVSDIAIDPTDPFTFYVALGTGGLMKTSNDGGSFGGVFDKEDVAAVGAVSIAPSNAKYVWVGTGEANDRNSSSWGNGVYLSTDGGGSWKNVGLKDTKTIARIAVHPADSTTAWVAAMGDLWTPNAARGLYKTTDAGATWKLVLSAASHGSLVGCGDVAVDPSNPSTVYAALYARQRTPWSFTSGPDLTDQKDLGGIFKSTDGGATWKKLENGLPKRTGRIGLSVFAKNPSVVYAVVASDEGGTSSIDNVRSKSGGVFRTQDGGAHWTRMSALDPRPFYFSQIRVDPTTEKKLYVLGFGLHVSEDSGKTFREDYFDKVHPDLHALAIDPRNPQKILLGTDGGVYVSFAGGKGWEHLNRIAAGEFYRITYDMSTPYRIAGGLQDNLNWVGPSMTRTRDGIVNTDWINIGGGDGFYCVFDPTNPSVVYAESQQGYVHRLNLSTGEFKDLRPEPAEGEDAFRFHWNSPFIPSRHDSGAMYLGGNRVFRLTNHGEHWQAISPDLSTQNPKRIMATGSGAENYGVVYTLAESPLKQGVLWAGSDDGKLWITENDGGSWKDLTEYLPKEARGEWISRVEAGSHDAKVAYLAVDAHRSGKYAPYAYRTSDGGRSWQSIAGNLPADGPVKVIREDLQNPDLLFAGTEFHLFASTDRGASWVRIGELPTVAVDDIAIHPRERDLLIATHGRSLFVIDDIRPLEEFVDSVRQKAAYLFTIRPANGSYQLPGSADWGGSAVFRGANPPDGAILNYWVKEFTGDGVKISIANAAGQTVANLSGPGTPGFNRLTWDLRMTSDLLNSYGGEGQKFVAGGEYTVSFSYGKLSQKQKLTLTIAPGIETR
jgi:photosystem II stability/assembly factor-like uncharacterized protein